MEEEEEKEEELVVEVGKEDKGALLALVAPKEEEVKLDNGAEDR